MVGDLTSRILGLVANAFRSSSLRRGFLTAFLLITIALFLKVTFVTRPQSEDSPITIPTWHAKTFVVSSMKSDDTSWIEGLLPDWGIRRYVTDDFNAMYTVPKNKGREAMVYLTYIIDNYHALPDLMVFIHGNRYQWHNDDPLYDGSFMLRNLQVPFLLESGYTNIRCVWTLGCPAELQDLTDNPPSTTALADEQAASNTQLHFPAAFHILFPNATLPSTVGVACCAQFAVTRQKIRERPIHDYIHYRDWLLETELPDHVSGRVLEYSWHIMFGQEAVHCPNAQECYCKVFGYCDLVCDGNGERTCGGRWPFPPSATLPQGWPEISWDNVHRSQQEVDDLRWAAYKNASATQT